MTAKRAYVLTAEEDQNDACEDEMDALFEFLTKEPAICPGLREALAMAKRRDALDGGAIAMQFAADYPARTRTLSVVHVPSVERDRNISEPSFAPQSARLGSAASKEMVDYWANMFATAPEIPAKGLLTAVSKSDPARDGLLQRIKAPTLLMTADRGQSQSVEKARQYQTLIPNSRLVVLQSDGYHIAASNADECVTNVLAFIKKARKGDSRSLPSVNAENERVQQGRREQVLLHAG
jgi:hypothetical protein